MFLITKEESLITKNDFQAIIQVAGHVLKSINFGFNENATFNGVEEQQLKLPKLKEFTSDSKTMNDEDLKGLTRLCHETLTSLEITGAAITGKGLSQEEVQFLKLKTLVLRGCKQVDDLGAYIMIKMTTDLRSLNLSYTNITGEGLCLLANQFRRLRELNLSYCDKLTDQNACKIIVLAKELRVLRLSRTKFSGDALSASSNTLLETVELRSCEHVSGKGLCKLMKISPNIGILELLWTKISNLEMLSVSRIKLPKLTHLTTTGPELNEDFRMLLLSAENLQNLTMYDNAGLTGEIQANNGQLNLRYLQTLTLTGCKALTDQGKLLLLYQLS